MKTISARNVSSILGVDPYETCWELLENKIENKHPFFGNKFTEHGCKYEKTALFLYEKLTGNEIIHGQKQKKHHDYPWLVGRIDGITHNNCIVEIKCPWSPRDEPLSLDNIPTQYWVQCQVYMNLFDTEVSHYVEYNVKPDSPTDGSSGKIEYIAIFRDRKWWNNNIEKIEKFYKEMCFWNEKKSLNEHPIRQQELIWSKNFNSLN